MITITASLILLLAVCGLGAARVGKVNQANDPLVNAHLIVEAVPETVELKSIYESDWGIRHGGDTDLKLTFAFIRMRIEKVMKGLYHEDHITIVSHPFLAEYVTVGTPVIVCAYFNKHYENGCYFIRNMYGYLAKTGDTWIRQADRKVITRDAIDRIVEQTSPTSLTKAADLVVVGPIQDIVITEETDSIGRPAQFTKWDLRVEQLLKGDIKGDHVEFVMMTGGLNVPDWRTSIPRHVNRGQTYIVFLKKADVGYIPFGGVNGFLRLKGDSVVLDDSVVYDADKRSFVRRIKEGVSMQRRLDRDTE
jgi:hypothetical protein